MAFELFNSDLGIEPQSGRIETEKTKKEKDKKKGEKLWADAAEVKNKDKEISPDAWMKSMFKTEQADKKDTDQTKKDEAKEVEQSEATPGELEQALQAEREKPRVTAEFDPINLSLEAKDVVDLPLDATSLHTQVEYPSQEKEKEDEEKLKPDRVLKQSRPRAEEKGDLPEKPEVPTEQITPAQEQVPEEPEAQPIPPPIAAGESGGNQEPPLPPDQHAEQPFTPEPERGAEHHEETDLVAAFHPEALEQSSEHVNPLTMAGAMNPNQAPTTDHTSEQHTKETHVEHGGGGLVAIAVDWLGRRRLRRELRRGQTKQNEEIGLLQQQQHTSREIYQRQRAEQIRLHDELLRQRNEQHQINERLRTELHHTAENIAGQETKPADKAAIEQGTTIPSDRHVEQSAWHRIEVDNKSGRVVEAPTVAYGHEFSQEKRPETRQEDDQVAVASGQLAVGDSTSVGLPPLPPAPSQSPVQYATPRSTPQRRLLELTNELTNPWFLTLIVIVIFVAIAALITS